MTDSLDDLRIEVVDDDMASILRAKMAERLAIASGMFASARRMIVSHLAAEHPDWRCSKRFLVGADTLFAFDQATLKPGSGIREGCSPRGHEG